MSKFRVIKVLPFAKLDKNSNVTDYEYQAYVSDGNETFVVGPEDTMSEAKRKGRESAKRHNEANK